MTTIEGKYIDKMLSTNEKPNENYFSMEQRNTAAKILKNIIGEKLTLCLPEKQEKL